jgi:hypothetical protein
MEGCKAASKFTSYIRSEIENWWKRNSGKLLTDVSPSFKIKLQVQRNYANICHCISNNNYRLKAQCKLWLKKYDFLLLWHGLLPAQGFQDFI